MPSISKWAKKQLEMMQVDTQQVATKAKNVGGSKESLAFKKSVGIAMGKSKGGVDLDEVAKDILQKAVLPFKALDDVVDTNCG
jgi:hypothetical protein